MPEKTAEDFFTDEKGIRWFKTGDIGRFQEDGKLTIVDRKKDLVKLQLGEYISLGKVEAQLKTCPIVDNCCIYGDGMQNYVVALVVANKERLEVMAEKLSISGLSFEELCKNKDITGAVLKDLQAHGKRVGLQKFELPGENSLLLFSFKSLFQRRSHPCRGTVAARVWLGDCRLQAEAKANPGSLPEGSQANVRGKVCIVGGGTDMCRLCLRPLLPFVSR